MSRIASYLSNTLVWSVALLVTSSGAIAQSELSRPDGLTVDSIELELAEAACSTGQTKWSQNSGPLALNLVENGASAKVTVAEPGNYRFALECCSSDRKTSLLNSPDKIGFGRKTTGGTNASSFTVVSNTNDSGAGSLRDALRGASPAYIIFSPNIYGQSITVKSNINVPNKDITLDGRGANITIKPASGIKMPMFSFRGGNTIITGITFNGNGTQSTGIMLREGYNYWLDHITVTNFSSDDALSIGQGSRPNTSASEVTVSNYRVYNTSKGLLAGGNDKYPNFPSNRTTIHNSNLGATDRNPRIQYGGTAHIFNTYIHSFTYAGMDATHGAQIISEGNVFQTNNAKNDSNAQMGRSTKSSQGVLGPTGNVYSEGDLFLGNANTKGSINPSNPGKYTFDSDYTYSLKPASEVVAYVQANAGAENSTALFDSCSTYEKQVVVSSN